MAAEPDRSLMDLLDQQLHPTSPLAPDADLRAAGLTSIATIDLLMRIESHYRITFPDSALTGATFATPTTLWQLIADQIAARPAS